MHVGRSEMRSRVSEIIAKSANRCEWQSAGSALIFHFRKIGATYATRVNFNRQRKYTNPKTPHGDDR